MRIPITTTELLKKRLIDICSGTRVMTILRKCTFRRRRSNLFAPTVLLRPLIAGVEGVPDLPQFLEVAYHLESIAFYAFLSQGLHRQVIIHNRVIHLPVGHPFFLESGVAGVPAIKHWPPTIVGPQLPPSAQECCQIQGGRRATLSWPPPPLGTSDRGRLSDAASIAEALGPL